jgi:hypothetical protein
MRHITKTTIVLLFISFIFSCENNEFSETNKTEIKQKLETLEEQIIANENFKKSNEVYTIDETYSAINDNDSIGLFFFTDFIEEVDYMIESGDFTKSEIQNFIEDESGKLNINEIPKDLQADISELIIESYITISEGRDVIGISKQYEQFLNDNISDESIQAVCFSTISLKKWAEFRYYNGVESQNKFTPCAYRSCFDSCMLRTVEGMDTNIEWILFWVGGGSGPSASLLSMSLICGEKCIF